LRHIQHANRLPRIVVGLLPLWVFVAHRLSGPAAATVLVVLTPGLILELERLHA
jgi:hypothetical protein